MPIFPRYHIPEQDIPTVAMPVPEVSTRNATLAKTLGAVAEKAGGVIQDVILRRKQLHEATQVANTMNTVEEALDAEHQRIQGDRSLQGHASDVVKDFVGKNESRWLKGLSAEQQMVVKERIGAKVVDYIRKARGLENTYALDEAESAVSRAGEAVRRNAYDLSAPDSAAFRDIYTDEFLTGEHITGEVGRKRTYNGAYVAMLDDYVERGKMTRAKAEEELRKVERESAYGRLGRMLKSDNPAMVQRGLDLLAREEADPGSTFVTAIDPLHRNQAVGEGQGQLVTIQNRVWTNAEHQRALELRKREAIEKPRITELTRQALNGSLTIQALDTEAGTNVTLSESHATYEHLRKLISESAKDTPTDNLVYARLWAQAVRGSLTVNDVLGFAGVSLSRKDAEHLLTVNANRGLTDDDLFKSGLRDIDNSVKPPVGIVDKASHLRYAEAVREYYDRALTLHREGKRHELVTMARQVADRWRGQARDITVSSPRDMVRHATPDDTRESAGRKTYDAWVGQYGPDKAKWPKSALEEYNRQMQMIDKLPTEAQKKAAASQPTPQDQTRKRGGTTPNPIPKPQEE